MRRTQALGEIARIAAEAAPSPSPETPNPPARFGAQICPTHGKAVLVTHVNDGDACEDYLASPPSAPREAPETPRDGERDESLDQLREEIRKQRYALGGQMVLPVAFAERLASRLSASEARAAAAERERDAYKLAHRVATECHDETLSRLASLLEKVERLDRYAINLDAESPDKVLLLKREGSLVKLSAVRSLLAPSEDTSDGN